MESLNRPESSFNECMRKRIQLVGYRSEMSVWNMPRIAQCIVVAIVSGKSLDFSKEGRVG